MLPAAMGWARRVQRLKNPGHATLRSHIAEVGSRLKAWRRGEAARRRSDQSRDDGWARTRHRPIWTPLDARAPLCLELSGRASSRAGSCGEQHGAQVSAQLPAHPDTTSHAFSVKLALPCYTLHLRSRPHAPSWNRLRCFCVLDCQCVVCVCVAGPSTRRVVTHAHRIEVASTAGAALPWALKDAERARAVRAAGAAIAVWEVRSRTGVVQRRVLYGAARCRQRTGDTTKGKVSGTALSLAIWPACAHEQGGFRSGLRVAQLSQCGRFSLARRWCNVCRITRM